MGDPKKLRKKYETPNHPWNKTAIDEEKVLMREYGLKNKREIYLANSFIRKYRKIAKSLIVQTSNQALKEKDQMMNKLQGMGLLSMEAKLDDVLGLDLKDLLERRLQTLVFKKGLANSVKQARQFITHRHISIDGKEINAPAYFVPIKEESLILFKGNSALFNEDHPERVAKKQQPGEEVKEVKEKATEKKVEKEPKEKAEVKEEPKTKEPVKEEKVEQPKEEAPTEEPKKEEAQKEK